MTNSIIEKMPTLLASRKLLFSTAVAMFLTFYVIYNEYVVVNISPEPSARQRCYKPQRNLNLSVSLNFNSYNYIFSLIMTRAIM